MTESYTLYGMAASLYTGKVRAYMRRNHVPFIEEKAGGERFMGVIRKAVGRWIIPVVETPEGVLVQDGTDILDYFEARGLSRDSIYPTDPRLKVLAHIFELYGGEGMLRAAMHYRWNFDAINLPFIRRTFEDVLPNGLSPADQESVFLHSSGLMRKATLSLGVTPETRTTIEESYADFLGRLDAHLAERPFLFGAYPTIGDYGLFSPLYAHLGRDPKPLHIMQTTAPRVFRWTEQMNMPETVRNEITVKAGDGLGAFETLPDTAKSLLAFIAEDYMPELSAHIGFANNWLAEHGAPDTLKPGGTGRAIGMAPFTWRGHDIQTPVMPYRFYLLQRIQDSYDALNAPDQDAVMGLLAETGLSEIVTLRTQRRVIRENHLEGWV